MKDKVIVLTGYSGSGKDYTCQRLIKSLPVYNFKRYALADFLKELMCIILDMSLEEMNIWKDSDTKNRQRLIDFSEKGIKKVDKSFWVKKFAVDYSREGGNVIITDARYYEEFLFLKHFASEKSLNSYLCIYKELLNQ